MRIFLLVLSTLISAQALSQDLGIQLNSKDALEAYTLLSNRGATYLIDNCGQIINEWPISERILDNHAKFLDNGHLYYISNNTLKVVDWDNNLVNSLEPDISNLMMEYESIVLPNGNYLCLARYIEDFSFFDDNGYNFDLGFPEYDDAVVELDSETGEVVWEWRISDHVIQERDRFEANYGSLEENPGKLNLDGIGTIDWTFSEYFMINGMDYNPELDQIALSVRKMGEVIIIDHSTTTAEAKTDTGGRYGKGGDVLYRWGNPQNYTSAGSSDQILYYQHNPNWILHGEYKGQLMIYNNQLDNPNQTDFDSRFSDVVIIDPQINADGSYPTQSTDGAYYPSESTRTYSGENLDFFSDYTSGAVVLPNGNMHVTVGRPGIMKEISPDGELVWQFNILDARYIFRSEKYSVDHPAFEGKDLTPKGTIEDFNDYDCNLVATQELPEEDFPLRIYQTTSEIEISNDQITFGFQLFNINGVTISSHSSAMKNHHVIDKTSLPGGVYYLRVFNSTFQSTKSVFII